MTWTSAHRRGEVLRRLVETADRRQDGLLPVDVDGVAETFRDDLDVVAALQLRWHTRLAGRLERTLAEQPDRLEDAVVAAWVAAARELPGVRRVLDRQREHPADEQVAAALARADAKERQWLGVLAGRAAVGDPRAEGVGAAIEDRARARLVEAAALEALGAPEPASAGRGSLLDRLKAVVAA